MSMQTSTGPELRLLMIIVDELTVGGRARVVQMVQMAMRDTVTTNLVVLGERGVMMALLLSRVMASMVNTLAGTVEREMNWVSVQKSEPKYQTLKKENTI
eukprot:GFUD01080402.1.p1 GENE.GFUD01080402.1~~GFUD01080402.1.p1  ORF type:complete len:100 (-),score=29.80 GFUD01080402.1:8-307(-)